jgi:hypothetical protein
MSLVKKPEMTEASRAARRANGGKSRGSTTPAGKERARAANPRHGYYSDQRDEAIVALGEDPVQLRKLIDAAYEEWRPQTYFQSALVERTARLLWRMDRAERVQESLAVERVETLTAVRADRDWFARERYVDRVDILEIVHLFAGRPEFYATPNLLGDFTQSWGDAEGSPAEEILNLLVRLRKPQRFSPGAKTLEGEVANDVDWQDYLAQEAEEEVEDFKLPVPDLPVAEGEEREPLRLNLRTLAGALAHAVAQEPTLRKAAEVPSSVDRDVMWKEVQQDRALMRREEESCFRQFWKLTTMLMKLQKRRQDGGSVAQDSAGRDSGSRIRDSGQPDSAAGGGPPQRRTAGLATSQSKRARKSAKARAHAKNAGASGDVDENTGRANPERTSGTVNEATQSPVAVDR